jgi:hypothetical protein
MPCTSGRASASTRSEPPATAQRRVDELHRREIAEVEILEDQQHRARAASAARKSSKARRI